MICYRESMLINWLDRPKSTMNIWFSFEVLSATWSSESAWDWPIMILFGLISLWHMPNEWSFSIWVNKSTPIYMISISWTPEFYNSVRLLPNFSITINSEFYWKLSLMQTSSLTTPQSTIFANPSSQLTLIIFKAYSSYLLWAVYSIILITILSMV